jgi:hypothetical protein
MREQDRKRGSMSNMKQELKSENLLEVSRACGK